MTIHSAYVKIDRQNLSHLGLRIEVWQALELCDASEIVIYLYDDLLRLYEHTSTIKAPKNWVWQPWVDGLQ